MQLYKNFGGAIRDQYKIALIAVFGLQAAKLQTSVCIRFVYFLLL